MAFIPLFLSTSMSGFASWNNSIYGYATWGTRWATGQSGQASNCYYAHNNSKIWMHTVVPQDNRRKSSIFWEANNSLLLRKSWETAISCGADMVNLITWSDYSEQTCTSGTAQTGYTFPDISAYYNQWYKLGSPPTIVRDALYYIHRIQHTNASYNTKMDTFPPMSLPYGDPVANNVELLAFLVSPGVLQITQGSNVQSTNANAGLVNFTVPLIPGTTPSFTLSRNGKTVINLVSDYPIQTSVIWQDFSYKAGGGLDCDRPGDSGNGFYTCNENSPTTTSSSGISTSSEGTSTGTTSPSQPSISSKIIYAEMSIYLFVCFVVMLFI